MASNYPAALDDGTSLPNPTATSKTNSPSLSSGQSTQNGAIIAVEGKVGTGATTPTANTLLRGTGVGISAWSSLTSAQLAATISDETGTGLAVFATTPTLVTPKVDTINESTPTNGVTIDSLNIKDGALNTNNSVVTANVTDAAITPAKLIAGTGSSWVWQSWTPTLTNISGGTLNYSKYIQDGKTVHFRLKYTLAGAGISGVPRFTLPVTANSGYAGNDTIDYSGQIFDASTSARYLPWIILPSTGSADIYYLNATPALASTSSTQPMTWATGDYIDIKGTYEAA